MTRLRIVGMAAAWVGLALLVSAGAAGLVVGMDHVPGTAARAELTSSADDAASAQLNRAQVQLAALADDVDALGVHARAALASLAGQDLETVQTSVDEGAALVAGIRDRSRQIQAELQEVPGVSGPESMLTTSPRSATGTPPCSRHSR